MKNVLRLAALSCVLLLSALLLSALLFCGGAIAQQRSLGAPIPAPRGGAQKKAAPPKSREVRIVERAQYFHTKYRGDGRSGVQGLVVAGPISPVARPGEKNERPLPDITVKVALLAHGGSKTSPQTVSPTEIAQQKTNAQGQFRIALAPGVYQLTAAFTPPKAMGFAKPLRVEVRSGKFAEATLLYDTGIR
jgi:hypothetical protein